MLLHLARDAAEGGDSPCLLAEEAREARPHLANQRFQPAVRQGIARDTGHFSDKENNRYDREVAEFLMGHDIDKLGYDKSPWEYPEWFEEQYSTPMPWVKMLTNDPEKVPVAELHRLQQEADAKYVELMKAMEDRIEDMSRRLREELLPKKLYPLYLLSSSIDLDD